MPEFQLSRQAATDFDAIAEYTIGRFGVQQARHYRDGLIECFQKLAETPEIGRRAEQLATGLRRHEFRSHIVFYRHDDEGALNIRILHARMDVPRYFDAGGASDG